MQSREMISFGVRLLSFVLVASQFVLSDPAHAQCDSVRLYEKFGDQIGQSTGHSVAFIGDINSDGKDDFIVGSQYTSSNSLTYNGLAIVYSGANGSILYQKDGIASHHYFGSTVAGAGDLNGDGKPDFIICADGDGYGSVYVYSGADGSYFGGWIGFTAAGIGDVNGDGRDDIIVSNPNNDDDGHFSNGTIYVWSGLDNSLLFRISGTADYQHFGYSVAGAGDVNGDGRADFIVGAPASDFPYGYSGPTGAIVYSGLDGSILRSFMGATSIGLGSSVAGAGDINGDGLPDVMIGDYYSRGVVIFSVMDFILINAISDVISGAGAGDVNGDGRDDYIVGNPSAGFGAGQAYVYSGADNSILFQPNGWVAKGYFGASVDGGGDVNGDGRADVIIGAPGSGNGGDASPGAAFVYTYGVTIDASAAAHGTISPSGNVFVACGMSKTFTIMPSGGYHVLDVLVDGFSVGAVTSYIFPNLTDGHSIGAIFEANIFVAGVNYAVTNDPRSIAAADFSGDGKADLVVGSNAPDGLRLFINNGNGTFPAPVFYEEGVATAICANDFSGDGKPDLATSAYFGGMGYYRNLGGGTMGMHSTAGNPLNPSYVRSADFNGDTHPDLVVSTTGPNQVVVYFNENLPYPGYGWGFFGIFLTPSYYPAGTAPQTVCAADFNGDTKPDLATANWSSFDVSVLLNNGSGSFGAATNYPMGGLSASAACAGDFDGDGDKDIAVAIYSFFPDATCKVKLLKNNGSGSFTAGGDFTVGGNQPKDICAADFNGDGKLDLAVVNIASNNVTILLNISSGGVINFRSAGNYAVGSSPWQICSADFNADGKPDLAVANDGSNNVTVLLNQWGTVPSFICGDANGSGVVNIQDLTFLINFLYKGGPAPNPTQSADVNHSGTLNIQDITYLINFLYKGGPAPSCP